MTNSVQLFVNDLHLLSVTRKPVLFFSNSEAHASELLVNIEEMFLGTTGIVICLARLNLQLHNNVLPVAKRLNMIEFIYLMDNYSMINGVCSTM